MYKYTLDYIRITHKKTIIIIYLGEKSYT